MALERQDIITDDALKAPQILTEGLTALLDTLDQIRTSSKSFSDGLSAAPLPKLKTDTEGLTQAQVELAKVQNQISVVVAKNNDAWIANQQALKNAKDELKNSQATADSWTKSATAQNSSIVQLNDALNKNRIAYSNLRTEAERNSKSGQDLLKVIQTQDESFKKLSLSMGQAQAHVGGYRQALEQALPLFQLGSQKVAQAGVEAANLGEKLATVHPVLALVAAGFAVAATAITAYFEHTAAGEEKLKVVTAEFTAIWNSSLNSIGEKAGNVFGPIMDFFTNMVAAISPAAAAARAFAIEQHALALREIADIATKAEEQKDADALVFQSRDKLTFSDKERLEFAQEALEIKKRISAVDVALAQDAFDLQKKVFNNEQNGNELTLEQKKKLAELEAAIYNAEKERFTGTRRVQAEIIQIDREILDRRIANEKEHTDTVILNAENRVKSNMEANKLILSLNKYTIEERLAAQKELTEDESRLIDLAAKRETTALRAAADAKVVLAGKDGEQIEVINKNYADREAEILQKATDDKLNIEIKGGHDRSKLIIDDSAYFIALKKRIADEQKTADLRTLEEDFQNNKLTLVQYANRKAEILRGGSVVEIAALKESLINERDILKGKLDSDVAFYRDNKEKIIAIIEALNKEILALDTAAGAKDLQAKIERKALLLQLQHEIFTSTVAAGDNLFKAQQDQSNAHLQMLNNDKNTELQLAGNNANAKILIEHDYGIKIREEEKKLRRSQHDQAVFDRDIAAVQIAVNIAEGIAKIWGEGYPYPVALGLTAIVAAIGAAQEIAVLSKPIPAYAEGTGYHVGGAAMVAERGAEWVIEPGQAPRLYDVPNTVIPNLAIGSKVLTADETQAIERQILNSSFRGQISNDNQPIIINDNSDVVEAVNGIRLPSVVAQGRELMEVWESRNGSKKWIQSKIFW